MSNSLSTWMSQDAFVCWMEESEPWHIQTQLIAAIDCLVEQPECGATAEGADQGRTTRTALPRALAGLQRARTQGR